MIKVKQVRLRWTLAFAIIGALIDLLRQLPAHWTSLDLGSLVASVVVTALLGWMIALVQEIHQAVNQLTTQLKSLSTILTYQKEPLDMLAKAGKHHEIVQLFLSSSIVRELKSIPHSNANDYLDFLESTIGGSHTFEGVQRKPVRWFQEDEDRREYLKKIRGRKMTLKRRIFIIDDQDKEKMEEDLKNKKTMNYYWDNTGRDVETFWILVSEFERECSPLTTPNDFALYDGRILIGYDADRALVYFDVVNEESQRKRIFDELQKQIKNENSRPFNRIDPNNFPPKSWTKRLLP